MEPLSIKKSENNKKLSLFPLQKRGFRGGLAKLNLFQLLLLLVPLVSLSQWNPNATFYTSKEDCPVAMRICDATQEYNFELVGDGNIDDANGNLDLIYLPRTNIGQFESKICFVKFTPQYSGDLALVICPESLERMQFQIFKNFNCNQLYDFVYASTNSYITDSDPNIDMGCMGLGTTYNPYYIGQNSTNFKTTLESLEVGVDYLIIIQTRIFNQSGTHRFTIKFDGPVVQAHPDVFDNPECLMGTPDVVKETTKVYPNPFTNSLHIVSETNFATMALYDSTGKEILKQAFTNTIAAGKLAQGIYLLRLITEDGAVVVKKVVKQ